MYEIKMKSEKCMTSKSNHKYSWNKKSLTPETTPIETKMRHTFTVMVNIFFLDWIIFKALYRKLRLLICFPFNFVQFWNLMKLKIILLNSIFIGGFWCERKINIYRVFWCVRSLLKCFYYWFKFQKAKRFTSFHTIEFSTRFNVL